MVSNALKFTSQGEVSVTVDAELRDGAKILTIAVADTGIGVPAEALSRLFEPFVQADNTTTRRFGGTGLGLTICRDIAELMGGGISVRSVVGKALSSTSACRSPGRARSRNIKRPVRWKPRNRPMFRR